MRTRTIVLRAALTTLSVLLIAFIFSRSLRSADDSSMESGSVLTFVNDLLHSIGLPLRFDEHSVRKTAHFVEYMALGGLLIGTWRSYGARIKRALCAALLSGLCVAVCDELLQLTSQGRSCEIGDMVLDFFGVLVGAGVVYLIFRMIVHRKKDKVYE